MNPLLKYTTLILCFFAWLFLLIGCIGYANEVSTVKNVAWITYDDNSEHGWYALRSYAYRVNGVKGSETYRDCKTDFCDQCDKDGKTAFGLLIVAFLASTVATILSNDILANDARQKIMTNAVFCFATFLASLISIGVFMGGCYSKIADNVENDDKLSWGPGAVLSIIAMFLTATAFIILVIDYYGSGSSM